MHVHNAFVSRVARIDHRFRPPRTFSVSLSLCLSETLSLSLSLSIKSMLVSTKKKQMTSVSIDFISAATARSACPSSSTATRTSSVVGRRSISNRAPRRRISSRAVFACLPACLPACLLYFRISRKVGGLTLEPGARRQRQAARWGQHSRQRLYCLLSSCSTRHTQNTIRPQLRKHRARLQL